MTQTIFARRILCVDNQTDHLLLLHMALQQMGDTTYGTETNLPRSANSTACKC